MTVAAGLVLLAACSSISRGDSSTTIAAMTTTTVASTVVAPTTTVPTTVAPTTTVATTTVVPPTVAPTTTVPTTTPYGLPVPVGGSIGYAREHHDYPASDVFAGGCGSPIISPVNGTVLEARRADAWVAAVDNPATRGGMSIAILGDDGVRYYLAHLSGIDDVVQPGAEVTIGQSLGQMGRTGKAGACHVHFGISPPCPGKEWAVRRGVIWPWPYLDAWRRGEQLSPLAEIEQWLRSHPTACADAIADPDAADS